MHFDPAFVTSRLPGGVLADWQWATISDSCKLYEMMLNWGVGASGQSCQSIELQIKESETSTAEELRTMVEKQKPPTADARLGLGWHGPMNAACCRIPKVAQDSIFMLHQRVGDPVGTSCGAQQMHELVVFSRSLEPVRALCDRLLSEEAEHTKGQFKVFRWHTKHQYWRKDKTCLARPVDSVVLPSKVKATLMEDVVDFIAPETREWFIDHGIPYKRSYLFFGPPGTGKTSMIQAMAGEISRSICYLSPSHPDMTDDSLKSAVQSAPRNAILVLEDIDSLFGPNRAQASGHGGKSSITFSGLLNALDGVGMPLGQIFVMTTNHRERLDKALVRCGRVDLHLEFPSATTEQMHGLFLHFYPGAVDDAAAFVSGVAAMLKDTPLSMSSLQAYFIRNRKSTPAEAAANIEMIQEDLDNRRLTQEEIERDRRERESAKAASKAAAALDDEE